MGREEVVERAGEGERKLGKREEDKSKERGERERMDGQTDGWTGVVLLCLRVLLLGLCLLVWSFLNLFNKKRTNQLESSRIASAPIRIFLYR